LRWERRELMSGETLRTFSDKATSEVAEDLILEISCNDFLVPPGQDVTREIRLYAYGRYVPNDQEGGSPLVREVMREYLASVNWDDVVTAIRVFRGEEPPKRSSETGGKFFLVN
jgi:hypothetical protein